MSEVSMLGQAHHSRTRAAAWLEGETGDTMIEVVIAALIVALIAAAAFTGFSAVAQISGAQRHQEQAAALAQQDEFRLRGLNPTELVASEPSNSACNNGLSGAQAYGNACYTVTISNEVYKVISTSSFVSASGGSTSCSQSGTSSADYIETASKVLWGPGYNNDGRQPVIVHSLISPNAGGALVLQDFDSNNNPLAGVTITISGPSPSTSTTTLVTDSTGCAVFAGLNGGIYNISESDPGWVTESGVTTQSQDVVVGQTITGTPFTWAQLGAIQAQFLTYHNGVLISGFPWDTFSVQDTALAVSPEPGPFGTVGTNATSITSSQTVYPTTYQVWAGTCGNDDPNLSTGSSGATGLTGQSGATYYDPTITVPSGGTTGPVTVVVPSMLLHLTDSYSLAAGTNTANDNPAGNNQTSGSLTYSLNYSGSGWSHNTGFSYGSDYDNDETDSANGGNYVTFTFTGNSVSWYGTTNNSSGYANVTLYSGSGTGGTVVDSQNNVNLYSGSTQHGVDLYDSPGSLANGTYTLKISVTGNHQTGFHGSNGNTVSIDDFVVGYPATSSSSVVALPGALPYTTYTYDSCGTTVERPVASSGTTGLTGPSNSWVYPVAAPYGSSLHVCFANPATNTNTGRLPSSGSLTNTNLKGTSTQSLTIPTASGATGASALFQYSGTTCS